MSGSHESSETNPTSQHFQNKVRVLIRQMEVLMKKPTLQSDLQQILDKFIIGLNASQRHIEHGILSINFTDAAIFIQQMTQLYDRKVDLLWDYVLDYQKSHLVDINTAKQKRKQQECTVQLSETETNNNKKLKPTPNVEEPTKECEDCSKDSAQVEDEGKLLETDAQQLDDRLTIADTNPIPLIELHECETHIKDECTESEEIISILINNPIEVDNLASEPNKSSAVDVIVKSEINQVHTPNQQSEGDSAIGMSESESNEDRDLFDDINHEEDQQCEEYHLIIESIHLESQITRRKRTFVIQYHTCGTEDDDDEEEFPCKKRRKSQNKKLNLKSIDANYEEFENFYSHNYKADTSEGESGHLPEPSSSPVTTNECDLADQSNAEVDDSGFQSNLSHETNESLEEIDSSFTTNTPPPAPAAEQLEPDYQSITKWEEYITPILLKSEEQPLFDIRLYEAAIIDKIPPDKTIDFGDLVAGESAAETARHFATLLQLANSNNVELINNQYGVSNSTLKVKLLTKQLQHEDLKHFKPTSNHNHQNLDNNNKMVI